MNTALYYPHTSIESVPLLKTALLMWDKLEYIVPGKWFRQPRPRGLIGPQFDLAEALEIVGKPVVPNPAEQDAVHRDVQALIENGLPKKYLFAPNEENYLIYAAKFGGATWRLLSQHHLIGNTLQFEKSGKMVDDYPTTPELGLILMTLLAKACAGGTAVKVTDAKYAAKAQGAYLTRLEGGDIGRTSEKHETLVLDTIAPRLPTEGTTLRQLIEVRKNEDAFLRELRSKYREEVEKFLQRLGTQVHNSRDYERIWAEFHSQMKDGLAELNQSLRRQKLSFGMGLLEKIAPGVAAATTTYMTTHSASASIISGVSAFGLTGGTKVIGSIPANQEKRESLLRGNAASWLYAVQNPKSVKRRKK